MLLLVVRGGGVYKASAEQKGCYPSVQRGEKKHDGTSIGSSGSTRNAVRDSVELYFGHSSRQVLTLLITPLVSKRVMYLSSLFHETQFLM